MEPATASGGLKTWRKGVAEYQITARGIASHAGNAPEAGINAIVELAHQAIRLQAMNQLRKGTSVSVTMFQGGVTNNTIPPEANCVVDVRFLTQDEAHRVDEAIRNLQPVLPGSKLEIRGGINRPPLERNEMMIHTFQQAKALADQIGVSLIEDGSGGGSDGSFTAAVGVPTLDGLGAHGDGLHALHEHVTISSLPRRAAHVALLLRDWKFMGD
jgi:glutamate carboxypeptidase